MENRPPRRPFDADSAARKARMAGLMRRREASIDDVPIRESERHFTWPLGPRPADFPGLMALGM